MKFEYYNFKNNEIKINACMERVLTYYNFKIYNKTKSIKSFLYNLKMNNVKYKIHKYNLPKFNNTYGFILFIGKYSNHIGIYKKGVYIDSFNHFSYLQPNYLIILGSYH